MRLHSALLAAGLLLSNAVSAAPAASQEFDFDPELDAEYDRLVARVPCHPDGMHVIGASGAGSNNFHSFGLLGSLMGSLLAAVPKSTNITLPYPKQAASVGEPNPAAAIAKGTANMRRYLMKFHKRCKHTPIVLAGYSSGAIMASNNICGGLGVGALPSKYHGRVIAAVMYGDETYVSGQSWDAGTCTAGQGTHPRDPATCAFFASKLKSYCDAPDPDCCGGTDVNAHFEYPTYDGDATAFVQSQFNTWTSTHH